MVRVPFQNSTRKMTRRDPKLILRRSYMALTRRHLLKKTLKGIFDSKKFLVDLLDKTVFLQEVVEFDFTDSNARKDKLRYVVMVKEEFFAGEVLPEDVQEWLEYIAEEKQPWDPRLLANHIYMLESRHAYGMFMGFCSTIHGLRKNKTTKYEDLKNAAIFEKYIGWNIHFVFSLLNDTKNYKNPYTGTASYDRDIMGLVWLFRCCWQHPAQKFPHLMIAVVLGEEIPDLISDVQRALFDIGIFQEMA